MSMNVYYIFTSQEGFYANIPQAGAQENASKEVSVSPGPAKQFDIETVLHRAMSVFWEKGYAATTMEELQKRMGIGARSLYDTFGNKRALFIKTLDHYAATFVHDLYGNLDATEATLDALPSMLRTLQRTHARSGGRGCFLGVAMAQVARDDTELIALIRHHVTVMEDALYAVFVRSKERGQLDPSARPRDLARFYVALFQGLNLVSRIEPDAETFKSAARVLADSPRWPAGH